jgi:hypothetical protein
VPTSRGRSKENPLRVNALLVVDFQNDFATSPG